MKRLFMVDFRENGEAKHRCIETVQNGPLTDDEVIKALHTHIGADNDLDCVIEVLCDMTAAELNEISLRPESLFLPRRVLYFDIDEAYRTVKELQA